MTGKSVRRVMRCLGTGAAAKVTLHDGSGGSEGGPRALNVRCMPGSLLSVLHGSPRFLFPADFSGCVFL